MFQMVLFVCVQNLDETYKGTPKCTFQVKNVWKVNMKDHFKAIKREKKTNVYETNTDRNGDNLTENCTRAHIDLCSCSSSLYLCVNVSAVSATAAVNLIVLILWRGIMQIIVKWRYVKDARFAPHTKRTQASSLVVPWLWWEESQHSAF